MSPRRRRLSKPGGRIPTPVRKLRITELDPRQLCGKGTRVERIFRVEEKDVKARTMHLVFFDRHGWYCEHGPRCPAVSDVKKFIRGGRRRDTKDRLTNYNGRTTR